MAIVVSDTSPLRALHHLDLLGVLNRLFGDVLVPPAVADELRRGSETCAPIDVDAIAFVRIVAPSAILGSLSADDALDPGEIEAISLALEADANVLLIDEREGRRAAADLGVVVVGAVGVLLRAKRIGAIPAVGPLIERLQSELNFFVSARFLSEVLRAAGEA